MWVRKNQIELDGWLGRFMTKNSHKHPVPNSRQSLMSEDDEVSYMSGRICDRPVQKKNTDPLSSCLLKTRQENHLEEGSLLY